MSNYSKHVAELPPLGDIDLLKPRTWQYRVHITRHTAGTESTIWPYLKGKFERKEKFQGAIEGPGVKLDDAIFFEYEIRRDFIDLWNSMIDNLEEEQ